MDRWCGDEHLTTRDLAEEWERKPMTTRDEIAWAICPAIREYSCAEGIDPACQRCPQTVTCSEGEGIQACRHAADKAADAVLALSPPEPTEDQRYAKDIADWCQRSLDAARATGNLETRPFVQNAELIIKALRAYAMPLQDGSKK